MSNKVMYENPLVTHLAVDVPANGDRSADGTNVGLFHKQVADDITEFLQVILRQILAVLCYVYPPVQFVHSYVATNTI